MTALAAHAQLFTLTKEQMIKMTAGNTFERFPDGRPKVPSELLAKMKDLSAEDVWSILPGKGFNNQFEGNWQILHPGKKLIGRAITAQFMPSRPDLNGIVAAEGKAAGKFGGQNQWILDQLQEGDVLVVDLFGKTEGGTFVGDNLAYYVFKKTKTGGMVIDGAVRDLEGIHGFDMAAYFRGSHPTPISNVMLTGFNVPVRIGSVTVMPGDVVLGDREGVYFIPPQLLPDILKKAEDTKIHDIWTKQKFDEGKWKSSDIYGSPHDPALKQEYEEYKKKQLGAK